METLAVRKRIQTAVRLWTQSPSSFADEKRFSPDVLTDGRLLHWNPLSLYYPEFESFQKVTLVWSN